MSSGSSIGSINDEQPLSHAKRTSPHPQPNHSHLWDHAARRMNEPKTWKANESLPVINVLQLLARHAMMGSKCKVEHAKSTRMLTVCALFHLVFFFPSIAV